MREWVTEAIKFPKLKPWWETKSIKVNVMEKTAGINWFRKDIINKKMLVFFFSFFYFLRVRKEVSPSVLEDQLGLLDLCGRCQALPTNTKHVSIMFHNHSFQLKSLLLDFTATNYTNGANNSLWVNTDLLSFFTNFTLKKCGQKEHISARKLKCTTAHCFSWAKINQHRGIWNKKKLASMFYKGNY